jgi:hypothetical protein
LPVQAVADEKRLLELDVIVSGLTVRGGVGIVARGWSSGRA